MSDLVISSEPQSFLIYALYCTRIDFSMNFATTTNDCLNLFWHNHLRAVSSQGRGPPKKMAKSEFPPPNVLQSPHCITYQCHALPRSPPDELRDWPDSPAHVSTHPPALTLPSVLNSTLTASDSPATKISLSPQCVASRLSVYKSYTCKSKLYQTVNSLTNMSSLVWNLKLFSLNMVEIELWMVRSTYSFIIWEFYKMFLEFQGQKSCKLQRQMFGVPSL